MEAFVSNLQGILQQAPVLIPVAIFLLAFVESVAVIGMLIPGATILLGVAALAGSIDYGFHWVISATILGAWSGDLLSYMLGKHFEPQLKKCWPLSSHPTLWESGHQFFCKYGSASVFFGRFLGPLRALIPAIAGVVEMPLVKFQIANIASAIAWAPIWAAPGYYGGKYIAANPEISGKILTFLAALSLCLYLFWLALRLLCHNKKPVIWPIIILTTFCTIGSLTYIATSTYSVDKPNIQCENQFTANIESFATVPPYSFIDWLSWLTNNDAKAITNHPIHFKGATGIAREENKWRVTFPDKTVALYEISSTNTMLSIYKPIVASACLVNY